MLQVFSFPAVISNLIFAQNASVQQEDELRYFKDDNALDGNAMAGRLAEIFSVEMTSAHITCQNCKSVRPLAEGTLYVRGPGMTLRCVDCTSVLGRIVRARDTLWFEFTGTASFRISGVPN
jgi:hypothetical protein